MLQAVSSVNPGVILTGRKRAKAFNTDRRRQCVTYIKPHLLYMLNVALFGLVMAVFFLGDCTLKTRVYGWAKWIILVQYPQYCVKTMFACCQSHVAPPAELGRICTKHLSDNTQQHQASSGIWSGCLPVVSLQRPSAKHPEGFLNFNGSSNDSSRKVKDMATEVHHSYSL